MILVSDNEQNLLDIRVIRRVIDLLEAIKNSEPDRKKMAELRKLIQLSERLYEFMPDKCWLTEKNMAKSLDVPQRQIRYAKAYLYLTGRIKIRLEQNGKRSNPKHYIYKNEPIIESVVDLPQKESIKWEIFNDFSPESIRNLTIEEQLDIYEDMNLNFIPLHYPKHEKGSVRCSCSLYCSSIGKHPAVSYKDLDFSDKSTIRKMKLHWTGIDNQFNIGFPTDRFAVIDVDFRKDGAYGLRYLEEDFGTMPEKLRVKTGNGLHIYTSSVLTSSVNLLGYPGIDVRSKGGIVVAPFSQHHSGALYEWQALSIPEPLPQDLLDTIQQETFKASTNQSTSTRSNLPKSFDTNFVIPEGTRGDTVFRIAASERGKGKDYYEIFHYLNEVNAVHCQPPLEERELTKIVKSVCKRYLPNSEKELALAA